MDIIKQMQVKYLQRRKAEWLERLRTNERKEDELLHRNDLNTFVQVHRETELIHYKIDVLNSRIHNIEHPDKKYYVLERSFPVNLNINH